LHNLALGLDRTGAGHHDELISADFETVNPHLRVLLLEFLADELVRRGDPDSALDSGRGFKGLETGGHIAHSHHSDHYTLLAFDGVDLVPKLANPFANVVDFRFSRVGPHRDDHVIFLLSPK